MESLAAHLENCRTSKKAQETNEMLDTDVQALVQKQVDQTLITLGIRKSPGGAVRKGMYQISVLASLLQEISNLQRDVKWEGDYEGDDRDAMIAVDLSDWLKTGVEILGAIVTDETTELLAATVKAVLQQQQGEDDMKPLEFMKAAHNSLAGHFKKCAAMHETMAAEHTKCAASHEETEKAHKAAAAFFGKASKAKKADVGTDDTNAEGAATHEIAHKAMAEHHAMKATHHEKMAQLCKSHSAHCGKMAEAHESAEKALKTVQDTPGIDTDTLTKALETSQSTLLKGMQDLVAAMPKQLTLEDVQKTVASEIGKIPVPTLAKSAGLGLIGRDGQPLDASQTVDDGDGSFV